MLSVREESDAAGLAALLWPAVTHVLFPLQAGSEAGLCEAWGRCVRWPSDHLLAARCGSSTPCGAAGIFVGEDECRLMAMVGAPYAEVADAVLAWVHARYPGRTVSVGVSGDDAEAVAWARGQGFARREASIVTNAQACPGGNASVRRYVPALASSWASLHDAAAGGSYWDAARVVADAENWLCAADTGGGAYAAARLDGVGADREAEIFVAVGPRDSLIECLRGLQALAAGEGARQVVYFCEPEVLGSAVDAGFTVICSYEDWIL